MSFNQNQDQEFSNAFFFSNSWDDQTLLSISGPKVEAVDMTPTQSQDSHDSGFCETPMMDSDGNLWQYDMGNVEYTWNQQQWVAPEMVYDTTATYSSQDWSHVQAPQANYVPQPAHTLPRYEGQKKKDSYTCLTKGCRTKPFGRAADLDRHYKQVHAPSHEKESFFCDYRKCDRSATGNNDKPAFGRKDHFRDHLRDYHQEDIPKRGSKDNGSNWLKDRRPDPFWWRCGKCLQRIYVAEDKWECPVCKIACERDRQAVRQSMMS